MIGVKLSQNGSSMGKCERVSASEIRDDFVLLNLFAVNVQLCKRNDDNAWESWGIHEVSVTIHPNFVIY